MRSLTPILNTLLPIGRYTYCLLLLGSLIITSQLQAQVNTGGSATTDAHRKQVIGYVTNWDAWKAASAGVPSAGALTHLNLDYAKYTILNYSFFGVAGDGSLHSGDLRSKNINQPGAEQPPGDIFFTDIYSSWDLYLLFGELEAVQFVNEDVKARAEAQGFEVEVGGSSWTNPTWGLSGSLPLPLQKEGGAKGLLELGRENDVKIMASIGGWSMSKHFSDMAADPLKRARFIDDCKKLISVGFDGIDLDWEYPGPFPGMNFTGKAIDFNNFAILVEEIRAAIGPDKLITAAMSAAPAKLQGFDWPRLERSMDYFNMMTYDFAGGFSNKANHNAPVYPYPDAETPEFNWQSTLATLRAKGVSPGKINFGIPFYGRGVITDGAAELGKATVKRPENVQPDGQIMTASDFVNWPRDVYDGTPNYFYIKQRALGSNSGWTRKWDGDAQVPYLVKDNYFLSYDDEESVGVKAGFINDNELAGTIVWTAYGDLEIGGEVTSFGTKLKRWSNVNSPLVNKINEVFADGGGAPNPEPEPECQVEGGNLVGGPFEFTIDGTADNVSGLTLANNSGTSSTYVITDEGGEILGLPPTLTDLEAVNFDAAGSGICLIWHLSFEDGLQNASVGNNASDLRGCFDLSNSVTVTRIGGNDDEGDDNPVDACTDVATWSASEVYTAGMQAKLDGVRYEAKWWTRGDDPALNADGAGVWRVVGSCSDDGGDNEGEDEGPCSDIVEWSATATYTGGNRAQVGGILYEAKWWNQGMDPRQNSGPDGVWKLVGECTTGGGDDPCLAEGGTLSGGPFEFTIDGQPDYVSNLVLSGQSGANSTYVITDEQGRILGLPSTVADVAAENFDAAGPGVCLIWHLSYEDGLQNAAVGNNASQLSGCFDLSNSVRVTRVASTPDPGTPPPNPGGGGNPTLANKILVGYWHNFNNGSTTPRLSEVSEDWDVVNIAFAEPTGGSSDMRFTPYEIYNGNVQAFRDDVALLKRRGQKVLISIGGANARVELNNERERAEFVTSMTNIINTYGFNGLDIDLEGNSVSLQQGDSDYRNPTTPKVVNLISATKEIRNNIGADQFILSMAPETAFVQGGYGQYGGIWGAYLPVIHGLRSEMDYIHVQHYNTGSMFGRNGQIWTPATADFHAAMMEMLITGFPIAQTGQTFEGLRDDQVAIGLPATQAAAGSGYTPELIVQQAFDYLVNGTDYPGRNYTSAGIYPDLRGIMTWSINWDLATNQQFSSSHRRYLDGLLDNRKVITTSLTGQPDISHNVTFIPTPSPVA